MKNFVFTCLAVITGLSTLACKTIDQRYYYRQGIMAFEKHLPPSSKSCWLTPDLTGPSAGSDAIAEEEITKFLLEKNLCRVIEKHTDDIAGYSYPKDDVCPCPAGVGSCSAQCPSAGMPKMDISATASGPLGMMGGMTGAIGGGGGAGHDYDNWRSGDKLLERYKKAQLVDKLIVYRIDELNKDRCVIHFRVSDAKANSGAIEQSQTYVITPAIIPGTEANSSGG